MSELTVASEAGPDRRAQDVQALHRRRVPALGERPVLRGIGLQRRLPGQRGARLPQGRPRRCGRRPQGVPGWSGATAYNRGQVLYRVAEVLEGRRAQFADEVRMATGVSPRRRRGRGGRRDRPLGLVRRLGGQDRPGTRRARTRSRGRTSTSRSPKPAGVVAVLAPQDSPLLGLVSVIAPAIVSGNTCVVVASERRPAARGNPRRGAGDLRRARGRGQRPHRSGRRGRALAGLAHGRQRHRRGRRARRARRRHGGGRRGATSSGWSASRPADWAAEPGLERMTGFLETKTVWHPMGV